MILKILSTLSIFFLSQSVFAWGRHDLITLLSLKNFKTCSLENITLNAEPIEDALPDFLNIVIPRLLTWSKTYFLLHDKRYDWSAPQQNELQTLPLSLKEIFLWYLEDNIATPLDFSFTPNDNQNTERTLSFGAPGMPHTGSALNILSTFVVEPDAMLDSGFNRLEYYKRLQKQMGLFYENSPHTHTFRHYYVPYSLIPPLISPQGMAPYRAALYTELAIQSFKTNHPYWGFRFLSWAIHYAQDITSPWHTVFVPSFSLLKFKVSEMRKSIAGLHAFTEAFLDAILSRSNLQISLIPKNTLRDFYSQNQRSPWVIADTVENAALNAHSRASQYSEKAQTLFQFLLPYLNTKLEPLTSIIQIGGYFLFFNQFDFAGDGRGATQFLKNFWLPGFSLSKERDQFEDEVRKDLEQSISITQLLIQYALEEAQICGISSRKPQ